MCKGGSISSGLLTLPFASYISIHNYFSIASFRPKFQD